jgi:hypothetical protein
MYFLLSLNVFSSIKLEKWAEQILPGSEGERAGGSGGVGRDVAKIMHTHVRKCKNDKMKRKKEITHILIFLNTDSLILAIKHITHIYIP